MPALFEVARLIRQFDQCAERWHATAITHDERSEPLLKASLIHGHNFALWHEEDRARDRGASDAVIGQVKRRIDPLNQCRNDAIEALDEWVLATLRERGVGARPGAPLHSESVGSIVDRLSILSLKIYHLRDETLRQDADAAHRARCQEKLVILREQREDLAAALDSLLEDLLEGRKRFKVYRQMKMYNDPTLNPILYRAAGQESS
jgi:hypothetical protein